MALLNDHIKKKGGHSKTLALLFLCILVHLLLNVLQRPELKYWYLVELAISTVIILNSPPLLGLLSLILIANIEGQGRIIWSYHPFFRLIFDALTAIFILRNFFYHKKLIDFRKMPFVIYIAILLHFFWFIVQVFNVNNVGMGPAFAAAKLYIFPLFTFLTFLNIDIKNFVQKISNIQLVCIFTILAQSLLAIYQMSGGEDLLLSLSSYYAKPLGIAFTGENFRPFGTSFNAGGYNIYIFIVIGPALLYLPKKKILYPLLILFVIILSYALFLVHKYRKRGSGPDDLE